MAWDLQVGDDTRDEDLRSYLLTAQRDLLVVNRPAFKRGGDEVEIIERHEVVPGYIREGGLHLLNAEQGIGKSNFCLALFRDLISDQGTPSFLDLNLDRSKNWQLFLVGVDMTWESWAGPLAKYNLLISSGEGQKPRLVPEVSYAITNEDELGLRLNDLKLYREWALEAKDNGKRALFVFDSYNALLMNTLERVDEKTQEFARPLRELNKALGDTGATTIMLHHTPKGQSNSTASSGGGHNSLGSIPDVVIEMSRMNKNSDRMFLASAKRINTTTLMVEQYYEEGRWVCHGDAQEAAMRRDLIEKISALRGHHEKTYDTAAERWDTQKTGFTTKDVEKWCDVKRQNACKYVRLLESRGVIWQCDEVKTTGRPLGVYIPAENKAEYLAAKKQTFLSVCNPLNTPAESGQTPVADTLNTLNPYERTNVGEPVPDPVDTKYKKDTKVTSDQNIHKVPEVNVYGQATPRPQMQAETEDGTAVVITGPGDEQGFWKYQKLGDANGVIREGRWMIDLLPSGTYHPPGTPL